MTSIAVEPSLSRASVRRLAHDVQQRLTKHSHEGALEELKRFLRKMLTISLRVATFSRRKAIAREHVLFAAEALMPNLPAELLGATSDDLSKIQRCNIRAPAAQRKRNAFHAEVSEAAFARVVKKEALGCREGLRLSAQARRLLHLIAEQHLMAFFSSNIVGTETCEQKPLLDLSTSDTLQRCLGCSDTEVKSLCYYLTSVTNQIPPLLRSSCTRTVDGCLMRAAACISPRGESSPRADSKLVKICDRVLRGRAADRRVTNSAAQELARALQRTLANGFKEVV